MIEIQLVQRSRRGVAIPIARSEAPDLIRQVAAKILAEMGEMRFTDEVLDAFAKRERKALSEILAEEGIAHA